MNFHDEFEHKFIDFTRERWTYETCDSIPFQSQLDSHPKLTPEISVHLRKILPEDALRAIEVEACYFLFGQENQQVDKPTLAKDVDFPDEIYGNATDIVDEYLNSVKDYFSFLVGNNEYRTYSDRLMKHCHPMSIIDGKEYRNTFSIIYPTRVVEEQNEVFKIFYTEETPWADNPDFYNSTVLPLQTPEKDVYEIPMPKDGQALLLYFNSCNGIHWIENLCDNNYMCHIFDAATLRKPLDA